MSMTLVRDIMERDLLTVPPNASVASLLKTLEECRITGVPVVDEQEILVGVVTSRDVLRLAKDLGAVPEALRWGLSVAAPPRESACLDVPVEGEFFAYYVTPTGGFVDVRDSIRELPKDVFDGYRVEDIMTRESITIHPDAPLAELAHLLRDQKIHRALVTHSGKLVGIATTSDVLKAVAQTPDGPSIQGNPPG
jgi:CBS domain-containing protein